MPVRENVEYSDIVIRSCLYALQNFVRNLIYTARGIMR